MSKQLTIQTDGVSFAIDTGLEDWVTERKGRTYLLYELQSIASIVRQALVSPVHRVELYGVPPERLYVKIWCGADVREEEWKLQFEHAGARLSRVH